MFGWIGFRDCGLLLVVGSWRSEDKAAKKAGRTGFSEVTLAFYLNKGPLVMKVPEILYLG